MYWATVGCFEKKWDILLGKRGVFRETMGCFGKQWDVSGNMGVCWSTAGYAGKQWQWGCCGRQWGVLGKRGMFGVRAGCFGKEKSVCRAGDRAFPAGNGTASACPGRTDRQMTTSASTPRGYAPDRRESATSNTRMTTQSSLAIWVPVRADKNRTALVLRRGHDQ